MSKIIASLKRIFKTTYYGIYGALFVYGKAYGQSVDWRRGGIYYNE